jgi:hypothetical protein
MAMNTNKGVNVTRASRKNGTKASRLTTAVRRTLRPRHFAVTVLALSLAFIAGAHSLAQATDRTVLALGPIGQHANGLLAVVADDAGIGRVIRNPDQIVAAARKTLAVAPLNASAASLIGLVLDQKGDKEGARQAMNAAIQITRRDPTAQLWLGRESFLKGENLGQILRRYDMVLRTQPGAQTAMFAAMSETLADARMRDALQPYVRPDNIWFEGFALNAAEKPETAVGLAKLLLQQTKPLPDTPSLRRAYAATILQIAAERQFEIMKRLYRRLPGSQKDALQSAALPQGDRMEYPPATWVFVTDPGVGSSLKDHSVDRQLELYAANEIGGIAARKLLLLLPGKYQLSWRLDENSDNPGSQIRILISCADSSGDRVIAESAVDARPFVDGQNISSSRSLRMDFSVANTKCPALWLDIRTTGGNSRNESRWVLSKLRILPVGEAMSGATTG